MQSRIDSQKVAAGGFPAMLAFENCVRNSSGLEPSLLELVRMRASQINWLPDCGRRIRHEDEIDTGR
jgi:hypothetical protein